MKNRKQQGIYAIPNKVKSLFNKFISWVLHIYPSVVLNETFSEILRKIKKNYYGH